MHSVLQASFPDPFPFPDATPYHERRHVARVHSRMEVRHGHVREASSLSLLQSCSIWDLKLHRIQDEVAYQIPGQPWVGIQHGIATFFNGSRCGIRVTTEERDAIHRR